MQKSILLEYLVFLENRAHIIRRKKNCEKGMVMNKKVSDIYRFYI